MDKLTHREPVADEPVAWLAPTEDDTRYVVIAPDSNEAIKDLLCAFPVYTHPAAPQAVSASVVTLAQTSLEPGLRAAMDSEAWSLIKEDNPDAAPKPAVTPFSVLDSIKSEDDLEAYVQARIAEEAAPQPAALPEPVPLPEPHYPAARKQKRDGGYEINPAYTADQMRAYGEACARAALPERADKLRDALDALTSVDMAMQRNAERRGQSTGYADGWHDCLRRLKSELQSALKGKQ